MNEIERIREKIARWLLENIHQGCGFKGMTFGEAATKILAKDGIEIRAENQDLPENIYTLKEIDFDSENIYYDRIKGTGYDAATRDMLKPGSEGNHWVKVIPRKEQGDE